MQQARRGTLRVARPTSTPPAPFELQAFDPATPQTVVRSFVQHLSPRVNDLVRGVATNFYSGRVRITLVDANLAADGICSPGESSSTRPNDCWVLTFR